MGVFVAVLELDALGVGVPDEERVGEPVSEGVEVDDVVADGDAVAVVDCEGVPVPETEGVPVEL